MRRTFGKNLSSAARGALNRAAAPRNLNNSSFLFVTIVSLALVSGCSKPSETPEITEPEITPGVTLDAETQARIGLKMESPVPSQWEPETKAYGRVLDPAPLLDLLMELGRAEITFDSSHQELKRAKKLRADNNISERAFQDIETTYRQNFAAASAVYFKIKSGWGGKIAGLTGPIVVPPGTPRKPDPNLDKLLLNGALIRIDLQPGEILPVPHSSRIEPLAKRGQPITASFFNELPIMDAQTQQRSYLFLNDTSSTSDQLVPGEAVTAYLKVSGAPVSGVIVPGSAVLRHEGKGWVYVQTATNQFVRTEIPLDRRLENVGVFTETLSATNRVVVSGAQTLLSAELSGSKPATND